MKRFIIAILILLPIVSFSQRTKDRIIKDSIEEFMTEQIINYSQKISGLKSLASLNDSSIKYIFSSPSDSTPYLKHINAYDLMGSQALSLDYKWDTTTNIWILSMGIQCSFQYNANGKIIFVFFNQIYKFL